MFTKILIANRPYRSQCPLRQYGAARAVTALERPLLPVEERKADGADQHGEHAGRNERLEEEITSALHVRMEQPADTAG